MLITSAARSMASRSARLLREVMPITVMSSASALLASLFPGPPNVQTLERSSVGPRRMTLQSGLLSHTRRMLLNRRAYVAHADDAQRLSCHLRAQRKAKLPPLEGLLLLRHLSPAAGRAFR